MRNTKFDETKVEIKEGARLGYEINMTSSHFRYLKKILENTEKSTGLRLLN